MKLAKSLLLGSAAGLVAVAGAQAADLPIRAKNYEYVRICSAYGAGFFYIPGTDTCLKIGGRVRAEYRGIGIEGKFSGSDSGYANESAADRALRYQRNPLLGHKKYIESDDYHSSGFRTRARIDLDARTATEYGTLRTYIRLQTTHNSGAYNGYGESRTTELDRAFVQFLGFTAGRTVSFFDFSEGTNYGDLRFSDGEVTDLLAYTATFGNGFSFTLSIEDPTMRGQTGYLVSTGMTEGTNGIIRSTTGAYLEQRSEIPDIVAAFRVDQAWGSLQLSAAAHQNTESIVGFQRINGERHRVTADDEWGFAVGLGAKINMDFLSPGDYFWLNATYASGALSYLGIHDDMGDGYTAFSSGRMANAVGFAYIDANGRWNVDTDVAEGWQVSAGFEHWWTPTFHTSIFGSYAKVDSVDATWRDTGVGFASLYSGTLTPEFEEYRVGLQNVWTPVKGLDLGLEVMYFNQSYEYAYSRATTVANATNSYSWNGKEEEEGWEARIRVQRDF